MQSSKRLISNLLRHTEKFLPSLGEREPRFGNH